MKEQRHVIWSNRDLDYEDWREWLEVEYPDCTEEERVNLMIDINRDYLLDERANLDIDTGNTILVIADLGLWNGRRKGFREIESGNIKDCLYSGNDYSTWFVDEQGEFRCDDVHHDGVNHYCYRVFKEGVTEEQMHDLETRIFLGTATQLVIDRYTRPLGETISRVYGWDCPETAKQTEKTKEGAR